MDVQTARVLTPALLFASGCLLEYKAGLITHTEKKKIGEHTMLENTVSRFSIADGLRGGAMFTGFVAAIICAIIQS